MDLDLIDDTQDEDDVSEEELEEGEEELEDSEDAPATEQEPDEEEEPLPSPDDSDKVDETLVEPPEGEIETETETFTKDQVEGMVQDRMTRFNRDLQETNSQLEERLKALETQRVDAPVTGPVATEDQDLGILLGDPSLKGWSLNTLKSEGYEEAYYANLGRVEGRMEARRELQEHEEKRQEEERLRKSEEAFSSDLNSLKEIDTSYFNDDGTENQTKIAELMQYGKEHGIYNLTAAHWDRNKDAVLKKTREDAIAEYVKKATSTNGVTRMTEKETTVSSGDFTSMDDDALENLYVSDTLSPEQDEVVSKILESRGLL